MMVAFFSASSIENKVFPSTQPSAIAFSYDLDGFRWPTITLKPLSLKVQGLSGALHTIANDGDGFVFNTSRAFSSGNSSLRHDVFFHAAKIDFCHFTLIVRYYCLMNVLLNFLILPNRFPFSSSTCEIATLPERTNSSTPYSFSMSKSCWVSCLSPVFSITI